MINDLDAAYRAVQTRDARFDGQFFTAVKTTGIYCRPACPARTPLQRNVDFYPTSAAAQAAGFRACRRCLPDAAPGSPEWNLRADTVGAAMRLIGDGLVDREGVPGLASRLGYTPRHLGRMLTAEVGAGPLALARARRAHTARVLLTTSDLPIGDIAFAAGFSSIRQFNETIHQIYAADPSTLRSHHVGRSAGSGTLTLRLAVREPFAGDALLDFLAARAVSGVEYVDGRTYGRTLRLPAGVGTVALEFPAPGAPAVVIATLRLRELSDLVPAVDRCRRLLDADADPKRVDEQLATDPHLADSVRACPGLRVPGAVDGPEILLRAMFGQQVSVAAARTTLGKLTAAVGRRMDLASCGTDTNPRLTHLFPAPADLAEMDPERIPGPRRRAESIVSANTAIAAGDLRIDAGRRGSELAAELVGFPGIGPWTAQYVSLRVLGDPDVLMTGDLVLRQGAAAVGLPTDPAALLDHARAWSPFRSYAGLHLWRLAGNSSSRTPVYATKGTS
ncbi:AraC family transcriptional regulator of adaptative response / DNA-3-methyladenine glycosylase II [Nakamurella sp. UYEF19]|uniref:DNA-3-methyladenine glycosylase 2 family protein n=1 Tax=Nakamurella sp. UYEF19 TaxID=1756392 RepID=UPI0033957B9D